VGHIPTALLVSLLSTAACCETKKKKKKRKPPSNQILINPQMKKLINLNSSVGCLDGILKLQSYNVEEKNARNLRMNL